MIQESILMDSFQSENVRKGKREEKSSYFMLSIYNTTEIQFEQSER